MLINIHWNWQRAVSRNPLHLGLFFFKDNFASPSFKLTNDSPLDVPLVECSWGVPIALSLSFFSLLLSIYISRCNSPKLLCNFQGEVKFSSNRCNFPQTIAFLLLLLELCHLM